MRVEKIFLGMVLFLVGMRLMWQTELKQFHVVKQRFFVRLQQSRP